MKLFKHPQTKPNWKYILIIVISAILVGGFLFWQFYLKEEVVIPEEGGKEITEPLILSREVLKLETEFIEKNEREVAYVQESDIWVLSKDLKKIRGIKGREID